MAAVALDAYSGSETQRLVAAHGHTGRAWYAKWVPTRDQLLAYGVVVRTIQEAAATPASAENVGRNR
jgi:hypothetical protein